MHATRIVYRVLFCFVLVALVVAVANTTGAAERPDADPGAGGQVYLRSCALCHGPDGGGDGVVAVFLNRGGEPRPRDFTEGKYKFRSTPTGELPTDEDLFRVITEGRPGFMPGFRGLSQTDRWHLVDYLKTLAPDFHEAESAPIPIEIGTPLTATVQSIAAGRVVYGQLGCEACHGPYGRGDGPAAATLQADSGLFIPAADLARPSSFGGGASPQDVYRTLRTGLTGAPMPSYASAASEEETWHLVNYILSLEVEGL